MLNFCGKKVEKKVIKKEPPKKKKKIINKTILTIENKKYKENDFKSFLSLHSKSFKKFKNRETIYSYIFEKFIIQKIILFNANIENYKFNEDLLLSGIMSRYNPNSKNEKKELLNVEKVKSYLESRLYKDIKIKEKDISKYYMDNKNKFRKKAEVLLYEIMIKDKKKANEIRAILNTQPRRFSEIARKESESRVAKEDGSLGYIETDSLPESLRKFIISVPLNKVTPVVELLYGEVNGKKIYTYHIFKVTKRKKKNRLLFKSRVRDTIKKELIIQKKDKIYREFIDELSNRLKIKVNTKNLFFKYTKK